MKIGIIGDTHGLVNPLRRVLSDPPEGVSAFIQVGDFNLFPSVIASLQDLNPPAALYVIRGNHDLQSYVRKYTEVTELAPNIYYVPDGTVMNIAGVRTGFIGGAASIDKDIRLALGYLWEPEEAVDEKAVEKIKQAALEEPLDLFVSHTPPQSVIDRNFNPLDKLRFGVPIDWQDPGAVLLDTLIPYLESTQWVCGHMHKTVVDRNVKILDVSEVYYFTKE